MATYLAVSLLSTLPHLLHAQEDDAPATERRDWHLRGQFAGYQGLLSLGGGPVLAKGVWLPGLMYGFAPRAEGRDAVHQVILRNDVVFMPNQRSKATWISPAASLNLLLETGRHSYLSLPDPMPRGYYMAPLPQITLGVGARLHGTAGGLGPFREWAVHLEAVGMGSYLWYGLSERGFPLYRTVGLSIGAGVRW